MKMRNCKRFQRKWLLVGVMGIAMIYVLLTIFYDTNLDTGRLERSQFSLAEEDSSGCLKVETKKILFWTLIWGKPNFYLGQDKVYDDCPNVAKSCWITHNRSIMNVEEFDAVLFHGSQLNINDLPKTRRDKQIYIFVDLENPEFHPIPHSFIKNHYFNTTMTYLLDSDIVWPYFDVRRIKDNSVVAPSLQSSWNTRLDESTDLTEMSTKKSRENESELIKSRRKKTKTAVWFVSHCEAQSKRDAYVNALREHVDVDIYGRCSGKIRCPRGRDCFREVVEPDYYFYLSFENGMCQDYVTEKLGNALKYNVVPIVYGGANYTLFAPPRSYINALDYESPKELANYLKRLIAEPREYDEYFEWKKTYKVVSAHGRVACQLCQYLHENSGTKSYSSVSDWYTSGKCPLQKKLKTLPYLTKKDVN